VGIPNSAGSKAKRATIEVLVADDHEIVRDGIRQNLGYAGEIFVAGEAASGAETIEQVRKGTWDVLILNLNLPDKTGIDVLNEVRAIAPELPVLILSMQREPWLAARALKAGAVGYIGKNDAREHLVTAVRKVARGERFLTSGMAETLAFNQSRPPSGAVHHTLSDRALQVLCLIAAGKPPRTIAAALNVSVKTVATHRARLLVRMGLSNNAELVQYAIEHDLLPPRE
jgi:DNA-binding NarL/FixJ family response regulator